MSFQPVVPMGGLVGWKFLKSTLDTQKLAFDSAPRITRDTDYFEQKISEISSAEELIADRRLLRVALGAFGLQEDLDNRFLIRKILEGGTKNDDALANKLSDSRYKDFTNAFGFADQARPNTQTPGFGTQITASYRTRAFEAAVGDQDQSLRLAMNAERELAQIALNPSSDSEDTLWLRLMGNPPLREVFEIALGLPQTFAQLDIDQQLEILKNKASSGLKITSFKDLSDTDLRKSLIEKYLLRDQISATSSMSSNSIALTLLQSRPPLF
jgi:hypothetical protein